MKRTASKFILKNKINRHIKKLPIDDKYKPIVSEVVFRRALQFDRDEKGLEADFESLKWNLKSIRVVSKEKMKLFDSALAIYNSENMEVLISEEALDESPERIFHLIAHELQHVMLKDKRGTDKFDKLNYILGMRSSLFQELIAEKSSYRLVYPTENDLSGYNSNAYCYEELAFILDFIEATYGVNEQDLLEHCLDGRCTLAKFLSNTIGEEKFEADQFLDEIEVGGTLLFSSFYDDFENKTTKKRTNSEIQEDLLAGIDSLFSVCQSKIEDRLRADEVETVEEAMKLRDEITFSQYRLMNILKNRLAYYKAEFNIDVDNLWTNCAEKYAGDTIRALRDISQLLDNSKKSIDTVRADLFNTARFFSYDDKEFFRKFLMERDKHKQIKPSEQFIDAKKEKKKYIEGWNNKKIIKYIDKLKQRESKQCLLPAGTTSKSAEEKDNKGMNQLDEYKLNMKQRREYLSTLNQHIISEKNGNKVDYADHNDEEK